MNKLYNALKNRCENEESWSLHNGGYNLWNYRALTVTISKYHFKAFLTPRSGILNVQFNNIYI